MVNNDRHSSKEEKQVSNRTYTMRIFHRRPSILEVRLIQLLPLVFAVWCYYRQYYIYLPGPLAWFYYNGHLTLIFFLLFTLYWTFARAGRKRFVSTPFWCLVYNMIPPSIFMLFVFAQRHPVAAVLIADFIFIAFRLTRWASDSEDEAPRVRARKKTQAHRAVACLFLVAMLIPSCLSVFKYKMLSEEEEYSVLITNVLGELSLEHINSTADKSKIYEAHPNLYQGISGWSSLNLQERTTVIVELIEMESELLGVPNTIETVKVVSTRAGLWGFYNHEEKTLNLSMALMNDYDPQRAVETALHEFFHFYQHTVVNLVDTSIGWDSPLASTQALEEARVWRANMASYLTAEYDGGNAYENQPLEASARQFAEEEYARLMNYVSS